MKMFMNVLIKKLMKILMMMLLKMLTKLVMKTLMKMLMKILMKNLVKMLMKFLMKMLTQVLMKTYPKGSAMAFFIKCSKKTVRLEPLDLIRINVLCLFISLNLILFKQNLGEAFQG